MFTIRFGRERGLKLDGAQPRVALRLGALVVGALMVAPVAGQAQSLFSAQGLGLPVDPMDARARALGSVGPGLFASGLVHGDPSATSQLVLPTITATFQPTWGDYEREGQTGTLQGTRFPLVGLSYPFGSYGVLSASYGSVLDQRWQAERNGTFQIGGEDVPAVDRFVSTGGVAQARIGWAYRPHSKVGVGAEFGQYTGLVNETFTRSFDSASVGADAATFLEEDEWTYSGTNVALGVTFDPIPIVRVAASLTFGGTLKAEPSDSTGGVARDYSLPTELRLGASAALTTRLMATAGIRIGDWTGIDPGLEASGISQGSKTIGVGLEWGGPSALGRTWPVRLGYRRADLPFGPANSDPVESTLSAGLGINLAQIDEFPLAGIDVAFERGTRSGGVLDENFTRATVTLRVSGR